MIELSMVSKLIGKLQSLIVLLNKHHDLVIHQRISQSYYMQKCAELQFMHDQLKSSHAKKQSFEVMLEARYREVALRWKQDIRWLKKQLDLKKNPML